MSVRIDPKIPDLVSPTEAAEILGMSRQALHKLIQAGDIPVGQAGSSWVIRRTVITAVAKQRAAVKAIAASRVDVDQSSPKTMR